VLNEAAFHGEDSEANIEVLGGAGLLFFEIEADSSRVVLHRAEWVARKVEARPTRLVASYCTFNRAPLLIRNITTLLEDPDVAKVLAGIIVVDQGEQKVRDHPAYAALAARAGDRLRLVEQDNFGGAGGFTRCLLEAQAMELATHVLLMDDDATMEPESVRRTAAFLSLARGELSVGGYMLDQLRPREVVESGSRYRPEHVRIDEPVRRRVDRPGNLGPFLELRPEHYNGWWYFACPLAVLDRVGLPLPLFLRGDDVEFGCRLLRHGVSTVALPGVAVWHEPFEAKGRGWHPFYELRNLLVVGALHFPATGSATVARRFFSRLLDELLAYDYGESWLLCEAAAAYLRGPAALRAAPHATHQRLIAAREKLAADTHPRGGDTQPTAHSRRPSSSRAARVQRLWLVLRNAILPSPSPEAEPRRAVRSTSEQWYEIAGADVVAVEEPYRAEWVILRRSRGRFLRLLLRGLWLAFRLLSSHRRAVRRWQAEAPALMTQQFWGKYLGLPARIAGEQDRPASNPGRRKKERAQAGS
jgi:galactofuranosylgalactofuranosylrhamnosyl-N-acetylglucosaminyl-diphospho-decaprenol beta-1,5/1,6-galactofuranosyltransferase